jgi:hypothetical protein
MRIRLGGGLPEPRGAVRFSGFLSNLVQLSVMPSRLLCLFASSQDLVSFVVATFIGPEGLKQGKLPSKEYADAKPYQPSLPQKEVQPSSPAPQKQCPRHLPALKYLNDQMLHGKQRCCSVIIEVLPRRTLLYCLVLAQGPSGKFSGGVRSSCNADIIVLSPLWSSVWPNLLALPWSRVMVTTTFIPCVREYPCIALALTFKMRCIVQRGLIKSGCSIFDREINLRSVFFYVKPFFYLYHSS